MTYTQLTNLCLCLNFYFAVAKNAIFTKIVACVLHFVSNSTNNAQFRPILEKWLHDFIVITVQSKLSC